MRTVVDARRSNRLPRSHAARLVACSDGWRIANLFRHSSDNPVSSGKHDNAIGKQSDAVQRSATSLDCGHSKRRTPTVVCFQVTSTVAVLDLESKWEEEGLDPSPAAVPEG